MSKEQKQGESTIITLALADGDAAKLMQYFKDGKLKDLKVTDVHILSPEETEAQKKN